MRDYRAYYDKGSGYNYYCHRLPVITEESYRQWFRAAVQKDGETTRELAAR